VSGIVVIVLMGPMGCGKTTVGKILSQRMRIEFIDSDDYHPPENIEKMARGMALNDRDRYPWLTRLKAIIDTALNEKKSIILACSALKKSYRKTLGVDQKRVITVYLKGDMALLEERVAARSHQYMNKNLLASQLTTLEEPTDGVTVSIAGTPEATAEAIVSHLNGVGASPPSAHE
jgi:carbohydrate kinase (thermoresistant glucokinase family)